MRVRMIREVLLMSRPWRRKKCISIMYGQVSFQPCATLLCSVASLNEAYLSKPYLSNRSRDEDRRGFKIHIVLEKTVSNSGFTALSPYRENNRNDSGQ